MSTAAPPRPMGRVIGRQPDQPQIVPSAPNPWYGSIIEGEPFTAQQAMALRVAGLVPDATERITVRRNATQREMYWPTTSLPPVFEFECPVVGRRADGRIQVITPNGDRALVYADGWTTAPKRKGVRS